MAVGEAATSSANPSRLSGRERLLQEIDVVFGERVAEPQRVSKGDGSTHIDHEVDLRSDATAELVYPTRVLAHVLAQRPPPEFHPGVALVEQFFGPRYDSSLVFGCEITGIDPDTVPPRPAEKLIERKAGHLAQNVPEGDIDPAHCVDDGPAPTERRGVLVHEVPELVDAERVLAEEKLPKPLSGELRDGGIDDRLQRQWGGMGLSNPGDAFVGVNTKDEDVLQSVAVRPYFGKPQRDGLDVRDLHRKPLRRS